VSDFDPIRDTLLQFDPDTRAEVIEAMKALRALPVPAAVRVLVNESLRQQLLTRSIAGSL
jgi:hypothetical protein